MCCPLPSPTVAVALAFIEISPTLLQAPLQGLSRLLPAGTSPLPPPGLNFSHRYLYRLAPPVTPHPRAELKEPAAVAIRHLGLKSGVAWAEGILGFLAAQFGWNH